RTLVGQLGKDYGTREVVSPAEVHAALREHLPPRPGLAGRRECLTEALYPPGVVGDGAVGLGRGAERQNEVGILRSSRIVRVEDDDLYITQGGIELLRPEGGDQVYGEHQQDFDRSLRRGGKDVRRARPAVK